MQQTLILLGVFICNSSQKLIQTALSRTARSIVFTTYIVNIFVNLLENRMTMFF